MTWRFRLTPEAERDIARLDTPIAARVKSRLAWFIEHADGTTPLPLSADLAGFFKLRAGDWRIVYSVDEEKETMTIHGVEHRSKVYKRYS